MNGDSQSQHNL